MQDPKLKHLGKFLSLVLRHKPEVIGIQLDPRGWVDVQTLLTQCLAHGKAIDEATLQAIIATNNKQRYILSQDGKQIRANQGHSVPILLDYAPETPPAHLYHGTAERFLDSILEKGLLKQQRHHVHLSGDRETASQVGRRHGKLVILEINTGQMHRDGLEFFHTPNGVWLTEHVPARYIEVEKEV
ncbi:RNA 2'-phosphotransferase [Flavilitoribacter nigricans]|uniref:Probable RNA 2'-phosphotransferase n=1 Tax=Flavilitoribacter nigricans (strain ATCC 23147 / DSM 23189 / NBRC 102662 / NCIMB 1420 / SS-2) TaxID=1122177 RepID=A0A2D0N2T3_FLAN2|nr:RNA 2'-phosphotransferase [Flavilitoribacter nigricans]PHN02852.1 RNA 2'-phosphotransferase [Flavilitoribacter nigricans DSM 23189 = NBRC 102662]